jgi:hypothetical protein
MHYLRKYAVDQKIIQPGAGQDMNFASARRAPARLGSVGEKDDHGMPPGCRDMCCAGVIPNSESGRVGKIGQAGKPGAAYEVDRFGASSTDFSGERLLALSADNHR